MKHPILKTALLASTVAALVSFSASAQTALNYNSGDLILGFKDASASSTYVLDLGPVTNFTDAVGGAPFTVSLGGTAAGIATDLNSIFGNWATDGSLSWGAIATLGTSHLFVTDQNYSGPGSATDFTNGTLGNAASVAAKVNNLGSLYALTNGQTNFSTANSTIGYVQGTGANTFYGDNAFQDGSPSTSFGYAVSILGQDVNETSITNSTLELESLNPAYGASNAPGDYGTFSIADVSGGPVVTFTPGAVPEPSSIALLGLGLVGFAARRRRA